MQDSLCIAGHIIPKACIIDMGTYLREEYAGEVYDPRPLQDLFAFLMGGWLLYILNAATSIFRTKPSYDRIPMLVLILNDGNSYEVAFGRDFNLSTRDVKRILKDFKRHRELYGVYGGMKITS